MVRNKNSSFASRYMFSDAEFKTFKKNWEWDLSTPDGGRYINIQNSKNIPTKKKNTQSNKNIKEELKLSTQTKILIGIVSVLLLAYTVFDGYQEENKKDETNYYDLLKNSDVETPTRYSVPENPPYNGTQEEYWGDGTLSSVNHYEDGYKIQVDMYDRNGNLVARSYYRHGEYIKTVQIGR